MKHNQSNRIISIALLSVAILALFGVACGGDDEAEPAGDGATEASEAATPGSCSELNLLTWEGYTDESLISDFEDEWDVKINATFLGSDDEVVAKMAAGGEETYDLISVAASIAPTTIALGGVKPLDTAKLSNADAVFDYLRDPFVSDDEVYGVPYDWDVNPFLYYDSGVSETPASWDALWDDPKLADNFAIWDDSGTLFIGAAVLGLDDTVAHLSNLSDEELDAIKEKMLELKPRAVWTSGGDVATLLANKEVAAAVPGWTYTYNELKRKNPDAAADLHSVVFDDQGATAWTEAYMITTGISTECEAVAYEFIDYLLSPEIQAKWGEFIGYIPANPQAVDFMDADTIEATHMDDPEGWFSGAILKPDPGERRQAYVETWQEIRQGLGN